MVLPASRWAGTRLLRNCSGAILCMSVFFWVRGKGGEEGEMIECVSVQATEMPTSSLSFLSVCLSLPVQISVCPCLGLCLFTLRLPFSGLGMARTSTASSARTSEVLVVVLNATRTYSTETLAGLLPEGHVRVWSVRGVALLRKGVSVPQVFHVARSVLV